LADELKKDFAATVELNESSGGVFEVTVDGNLIFSKKNSDRFPEPGEIQALIRKKIK
jgi:selenoprotein W-related protein